MWDEVLGHQLNKEFCKTAETRQPPHALLFYGMGGIGKKCWPCILQKHFYASLRPKSPAVFARAAV